MGSFTKDYQTEMTKAQRAALQRAAEVPVNYMVNKQGRNVIVTVTADEGRVVAKFYETLPGVDHKFFCGTVILGSRGGILFNSIQV